jgi:hypothetical protein
MESSPRQEYYGVHNVSHDTLCSTTCHILPCVPQRVPFYLVSTTCPILPLCPQRVPRYLVSTKYPILPCVLKQLLLRSYLSDSMSYQKSINLLTEIMLPIDFILWSAQIIYSIFFSTKKAQKSKFVGPDLKDSTSIRLLWVFFRVFNPVFNVCLLASFFVWIRIQKYYTIY